MQPRKNVHGSQSVYKDPLDVEQVRPKNNLLGLCKNAWFPWQPIMDSKMGVSAKLLMTTNRCTKLKLRQLLDNFIQLSHMQII